jgi:polysaccharide export outer membrane protein
VLDIRVLYQQLLSRVGVLVDYRGMITMPLIEGEIQAACRTEKDLAKEITSKFLDYVKNPQVDVFVKEYQSKPVAVIGAVNQPGRFQLQRQVRLLELLTFAGGPNIERAGRSLHIVHTATSSVCRASSSAQTQDEISDNFITYNLNDVLRGTNGSNPYVQSGDIITLPEAEQAYVVGNVFKPMTIPLKEPITVSGAIAMAGGTMRDTKSSRVRIIRQVPGSMSKTEIYVDIKAIEKRRAEDVLLQANDIVDVPTSGAKSFLRTMLGTIVPSISQLPVRAIP